MLEVGRMTQTIRVIQVIFAGLSGSHPQQKLSGCDPNRSHEPNSMASIRATGLRKQVAGYNLASELPFIHIYLF